MLNAYMHTHSLLYIHLFMDVVEPYAYRSRNTSQNICSSLFKFELYIFPVTKVESRHGDSHMGLNVHSHQGQQTLT